MDYAKSSKYTAELSTPTQTQHLIEIVSFTIMPLYPQGNDSQHTLDKRRAEPLTQCRWGRKKKIYHVTNL